MERSELLRAAAAASCRQGCHSVPPVPCPCLRLLLAASAGELRWRLLSTLSGFHDRTVFSVDWSKGGLIASGCADNAIRIFGEGGGSSGEPAGAGAGAAAAADEEVAVAAADAAAAEPSLRDLFLRPGGGGGGSGGGASFSLLCTRRQAHPLDVNCVRWNPADSTLLASAGDDCCVKLWRWRPAQNGVA